MNRNYTFKPGLYFTITFITTYVLWFIGAYISFQENNNGMHMLFLLPGLMAPFIISLIMLYRANNADLKRDFFNRLVNLKLIQPKYLPVFFLLMPAVVIVSILISLLFGESQAQFQLAEGFSFSTGFVPVLMLLFLAALFEELGWRGYAFDSLQSRFNYFKASLIFSVLWSAWHFPLIFVKDSYQYEVLQQNIWYAVNFFVSIVPMGIIISWICIKNRKSVFAAILFHFIINMSQEILAITQVTKCIETVVLALCTVIIIWIDKDLFFSKVHPVAADSIEKSHEQ